MSLRNRLVVAISAIALLAWACSGKPKYPRCNTDGDCASLYCDVPTSTHTHKYCTDYCCTDADCGNGTRCRPVSESNAYILHCIYP